MITVLVMAEMPTFSRTFAGERRFLIQIDQLRWNCVATSIRKRALLGCLLVRPPSDTDNVP